MFGLGKTEVNRARFLYSIHLLCRIYVPNGEAKNNRLPRMFDLLFAKFQQRCCCFLNSMYGLQPLERRKVRRRAEVGCLERGGRRLRPARFLGSGDAQPVPSRFWQRRLNAIGALLLGAAASWLTKAPAPTPPTTAPNRKKNKGTGSCPRRSCARGCLPAAPPPAPESSVPPFVSCSRAPSERWLLPRASLVRARGEFQFGLRADA